MCAQPSLTRRVGSHVKGRWCILHAVHPTPLPISRSAHLSCNPLPSSTSWQPDRHVHPPSGMLQNPRIVATAAGSCSAAVEAANCAGLLPVVPVMLACVAMILITSPDAEEIADCDAEAGLKFMSHVFYFLALPAATFAMGMAASHMPLNDLLQGAILGCARFVVGILAGACLIQVLQHLCSGRVPVLSELYHQNGHLSAQTKIAQAAAKAFGSPQAAAALQAKRTDVPEGIPVLLLLVCAFPGCAPQALTFLPGWAMGVTVSLTLLIWTAGKQMVFDNDEQERAAKEARRQAGKAPSAMEQWLKVEGGQEVLMSDAAANASVITDDERNEVIEVTVTDVRALKNIQKSDGKRQAWAQYGTNDESEGSAAWFRPLAKNAGLIAAIHLPTISFGLGYLAEPLLTSLHAQASTTVLPWDGNLLMEVSNGLQHALDIATRALQPVLLLILACACVQGSNAAAAKPQPLTFAVSLIRMQSLFFPALSSDRVLLMLALAGQAAASQMFALVLTYSPLGKGLITSQREICAAAAPNAGLLVLLFMTGCSMARLQQAGLLIARMCLWGPIMQHAGNACMQVSLNAIGMA